GSRLDHRPRSRRRRPGRAHRARSTARGIPQGRYEDAYGEGAKRVHGEQVESPARPREECGVPRKYLATLAVLLAFFAPSAWPVFGLTTPASVSGSEGTAISVAVDLATAATLPLQSVTINWGDGTTNVYTSPVLPSTFNHVYVQNGSYTVTYG